MKKHMLSRTARYILGMIFVIVGGHLVYQYVMATATFVDAKTGTFVEGLTPGYEISYLPYTQTSEHTRLYQSMFFDACLDYESENGRIKYIENLCRVTTDDNKQFVIKQNRDAFWSHGAPLTLDDIYATYQHILIENKRSIPSYEAYSDVAIERRAEDLVVTFPESSIDNRIFFTYFIIPKQFTENTYETYLDAATQKNIGSGCAQLKPGTKDNESMVIDVTRCEQTNFNNYQLKYIDDSESNDTFSYVDVITGEEVISDEFTVHRIPERKFAFLFFNVESPKLSPKIQRALGGFIDHHIKDELYDSYMFDNQLVFTQFLSTGDNVANYIIAKNPNLPVDKYDLEKLNIQPLPTEVTLEKGDNPVYFLDDIDGAKTMRFFVDDAYDRLTIAHNDGVPFAPTTYNPTTASFYYTLAPYNANLVEGLNEYTIKGENNGNESLIAEVDVYYLTSPLKNDNEIADEDKISVVYTYDPTTNYIIDRLAAIFSGAGMGEYFLFEGYDDANTFEGRLLSQDYDMVLRLVDLGQRNDWRSLFAGKNPLLNPSLYSDGSFVSALGQYANDPNNQSIYDTIVTLYGKDMPFVILGQLFSTVSIRDTIQHQVGTGSYHYIYNLYNDIYTNVSLGTRMSAASRDEMFDIENIGQFLRTGTVTTE